MGEHGFTPGPWFIENDYVRAPGNGEFGWAVSYVVPYAGHPGASSAANAQLIAAAPELLRELRDTEARYAKALREAGYSDLFVTQATASIRSAISLATTPTPSHGLSTGGES